MEIGRVDDAVFSEVGGATAAGGSGSGGFSFALFSRISCSLSRERRTSRMSNHRLVPFVMLCLSIFRAVLLSSGASFDLFYDPAVLAIWICWSSYYGIDCGFACDVGGGCCCSFSYAFYVCDYGCTCFCL